MSGIVASATWFIGLRVLRPRLDTSPEIARDFEAADRTPRWRIKVVNRSMAALVDVKVELVFRTRIEGTRPVFRRRSVKLTRSDLVRIPGRNPRTWRNADYAFRFSTYEDLQAIWLSLGTDHTALALSVTGKHPTSGVIRSFTRHYYWSGHPIKDGKFETGRSMAIVPVAQVGPGAPEAAPSSRPVRDPE